MNIVTDDGRYGVCLRSNLTLILADKYDINVYDITGENIYHVSVTNNANCTFIPFELKVECAPFVVSINTNNYFGSSSVNVTINLPNQPVLSNDSVCSCLKENGMLLIKFIVMLTILYFICYMIL